MLFVHSIAISFFSYIVSSFSDFCKLILLYFQEMWDKFVTLKNTGFNWNFPVSEILNN